MRHLPTAEEHSEQDTVDAPVASVVSLRLRTGGGPRSKTRVEVLDSVCVGGYAERISLACSTKFRPPLTKSPVACTENQFAPRSR